MPAPIYRSNAGPVKGPARDGDLPFAISVYLDPGGLPSGTAFDSTWILDEPKPPITLWRLVLGKTELPGLFVLDGRVFVPVEEWLVAHGRGDVTV